MKARAEQALFVARGRAQGQGPAKQCCAFAFIFDIKTLSGEPLDTCSESQLLNSSALREPCTPRATQAQRS